MTERQVPPAFFQEIYQGQAPWDTGRPQPDLVALADRIHGSVLDAGCGTGEHALFYAARGHEAWGVDAVPAAIEQARAKAKARGLVATFVVGNALGLGELGRRFDHVVDSGLFHVFSDADRIRYVESLRTVLAPRGTLHLLCFSELTPGDVGPRRVTQVELRTAFAEGWAVHEIDAACFETNVEGQRPRAWRAIIERTHQAWPGAPS
jgi:cyclopropane fatty-acyl-phospholipid synthase-like methyltransferase